MIPFFESLPREAAAGLCAFSFLTGWISGRRTAKPFKAFWVGLEDVYAAYSEEQALKLAVGDGAYFLTLNDIAEVSGLSLCYPVPDDSGGSKTLAQLLQETRSPGWIAGANGAS